MDLTTWTWSKLQFHGPYNIDENSQFFLVSDETKANVFLLGGGIRDTEGKVTEYNYGVQRLDSDGWHILNNNITSPIEHQPAVIPLDFYWNNNLPRLDVRKMPQISKFFIYKSLFTSIFNIFRS